MTECYDAVKRTAKQHSFSRTCGQGGGESKVLGVSVKYQII